MKSPVAERGGIGCNRLGLRLSVRLSGIFNDGCNGIPLGSEGIVEARLGTIGAFV